MSKLELDPDLERQLDAARDDEPIEAVLVLRPVGGSARPPIDAEALMMRVSREDDHAEMTYMPRLGALVIRARSIVIRDLLSLPEIQGASANRVSGASFL